MKPIDYIGEMKNRQGSKSLREWAKEAHVSAAYLSDVYRGRRDPGPRLLKYLGLKKVEEPRQLTYVKETE